MKIKQGSLFGSGVLGFALAGLLFSQGIGQTQPPRPGIVRAYNQVKMWDDKAKPVKIVTFISLFKNGEQIRSTEKDNALANSVIWPNIPQGAYEVHFQTKGYGTVIKRIMVVPSETTFVTLTSISANDELWGGGPTLFDLQKRLDTLEKQNSAMQARLTKLENAK